MDNNRYNNRSVKKLNNKRHEKYPFQRAEQRRNNIDQASLREQRAMEAQSTKLSIGTFNIFPPKPDTNITSFTVAFARPIPKDELYQKLHQTFDGHWNGEPVKSIFVTLSKPMTLQELRRRLNENFKDILST